MVRGDSLKISLHARNHDKTFGIINQEDTTDVTLSGVVTHDTNPPWPIFRIMIWRLKGERTERLKLHLFVDEIECFMQLSIVTILLFGILKKCYHLFYLSMNQTYVMITYSWIQNIMIDYVFLIKFIQVGMTREGFIADDVWAILCEFPGNDWNRRTGIDEWIVLQIFVCVEHMLL